VDVNKDQRKEGIPSTSSRTFLSGFTRERERQFSTAERKLKAPIGLDRVRTHSIPASCSIA